jgi:GTP cyclohydrolase II
VDTVPIVITANPHHETDLQAKREKMGHSI